MVGFLMCDRQFCLCLQAAVDSAVAMNDLAVVVDLLSVIILRP